MSMQQSILVLWAVAVLFLSGLGNASVVDLTGEYIYMSSGLGEPEDEWDADDPHKDPPLYVWIHADGTLLMASTDERGPREPITGTYRMDGDDLLVFGIGGDVNARFRVELAEDITTLTYVAFIDTEGAPLAPEDYPSQFRYLQGNPWVRLAAQPPFSERPPVWMVELAAKSYISNNAEQWCGKTGVFWQYSGLEIDVLSVGPYAAAKDLWPAKVRVVTDGRCVSGGGRSGSQQRKQHLDKTIVLSYRFDASDAASPRWIQVEPPAEAGTEVAVAEKAGPVAVACPGDLNDACAAELLTRHFGFPAKEFHHLVLGEKVSVALQAAGDVEAWVDSDENEQIYQKIGELGYLYGEFSGAPSGWQGVVAFVDLSLTDAGEAALGKMQFGDVQVGVWGKKETVQTYYAPIPMYGLSLMAITGIRLDSDTRATVQFTLEKVHPTHWLTDIPMLEEIHGAPRLQRSVTVAKYADGWRVEKD